MYETARPNAAVMSPVPIRMLDMALTRCWAVQGELWRPVVVESAPMRLIVFDSNITFAHWLPRLIECLKVKDIHSEGEGGAYAGLEECLLVFVAGLGCEVTCSSYSM